MVTVEQARARIWESIEAHGGPTAVWRAIPARSDGKAAVSTSLLYKFRKGENVLGRDSVTALQQVLDDVDAETWLAAMGVSQVEARP